jgi:hypothetical protein
VEIRDEKTAVNFARLLRRDALRRARDAIEGFFDRRRNDKKEESQENGESKTESDDYFPHSPFRHLAKCARQTLSEAIADKTAALK